jgi:hypothetical protein
LRPVCIFFLLLLWSSVAHADPRADELFRQGREAMKLGQCAKAIPLFEESHRLDPGAGTLLNLAACHAELGKTASAYRVFGEALYAAERSGDTEQAEVARERRESLLTKLASIRITVGGAAPTSDLNVTLDGAALTPAQFTHDILIDPGEHTLVIVGHAERKVTILADTPGVTAIDFPAAAAASPSPSLTTTASSTPTTRWPPLRVIGAASMSGSVIALGIATYFGVTAIDLRTESDRECPNERCSQRGVEINEDARANGNRATAFFVAGAATLLMGVVLYWVGTPPPAARTSHRGGILVW